MSAKEYLIQIKTLQAKARAIEEELATIREEIGALRSPWPDGQPRGSATSDPVGAEAVKLAEQTGKLEAEYRAKLFEIQRKRMEIITLLDGLEDAECHELLIQRYVRCERWEQIAINMGYSYQWVAGPLHGRALAMVEKLLNNQ